MIVYVAGPYRAGDHEGIEANILQARKIAIGVWESGNVAICPHLNTAHFEVDCEAAESVYLAGDLEILRRCDAVIVGPGWDRSLGTREEIAFATERGIPVYYWPDYPAPHSTEIRCPNQSRGFLDVVMRMYRVHLAKNADYSPINILVPGSIGIATRIWDKVARIMSLMGWRITVASSVFEAPREPACESLDDSIIDLSVYGVIWQLYNEGVWGK